MLVNEAAFCVGVLLEWYLVIDSWILVGTAYRPVVRPFRLLVGSFVRSLFVCLLLCWFAGSRSGIKREVLLPTDGACVRVNASECECDLRNSQWCILCIQGA